MKFAWTRVNIYGGHVSERGAKKFIRPQCAFKMHLVSSETMVANGTSGDCFLIIRNERFTVVDGRLPVGISIKRARSVWQCRIQKKRANKWPRVRLRSHRKHSSYGRKTFSAAAPSILKIRLQFDAPYTFAKNRLAICRTFRGPIGRTASRWRCGDCSFRFISIITLFLLFFLFVGNILLCPLFTGIIFLDVFPSFSFFHCSFPYWSFISCYSHILHSSIVIHHHLISTLIVCYGSYIAVPS